jgi:hypothetical protein
VLSCQRPASVEFPPLARKRFSGLSEDTPALGAPLCHSDLNVTTLSEIRPGSEIEPAAQAYPASTPSDNSTLPLHYLPGFFVRFRLFSGARHS